MGHIVNHDALKWSVLYTDIMRPLLLYIIGIFNLLAFFISLAPTLSSCSSVKRCEVKSNLWGRKTSLSIKDVHVHKTCSLSKLRELQIDKVKGFRTR